MATSFEWDRRKSRANLRKHKVDFDEAKTVFFDPLALVIDDPDHSKSEDRYIILGTSSRQRLLVVVHADRGERIRIISARAATASERFQYEEGLST